MLTRICIQVSLAHPGEGVGFPFLKKFFLLKPFMSEYFLCNQVRKQLVAPIDLKKLFVKTIGCFKDRFVVVSMNLFKLA